jgi:hypothetical protein
LYGSGHALGITQVAIGVTTRAGEKLCAKPEIKARIDALRDSGPSTAVVVTAIIDARRRAPGR